MQNPSKRIANTKWCKTIIKKHTPDRIINDIVKVLCKPRYRVPHVFEFCALRSQKITVSETKNWWIIK